MPRARTSIEKEMQDDLKKGEAEVRAKHPGILQVIPAFSDGTLILDCQLAPDDKLAIETGREWIKYRWREDY